MKHIILLFACCYLAFSVNLSAQNVAGSVEVGVYSAYQFGQFLGSDGINITSHRSNGFPIDLDMPFSTITFGGSIEYHTSPDIAFQGSLRFHQISASTDFLKGELIAIQQDGMVQNIRTDYTYSLSIPQITISITNKIRVNDPGFCIVWGLSAGVIVGDKQEIECRLTADPGHPGVTFDSLYYPVAASIRGQAPVYLNDARTAMRAYSGPLYEKNTLQFGYVLGVQYDIPIYTTATKKKVTLMPSILFNGTLTNYIKNYNLHAGLINIGIGLKMGI